MTDREFLLDVLEDGQPHTLTEILRRSFEVRGHGLTVHSRAADLRRDGYTIVWRHEPGAKRGNASVYQLTSREAGSQAPVQRQAPVVTSKPERDLDDTLPVLPGQLNILEDTSA